MLLRTVEDGACRTPMALFSMLDASTSVGIVPVPKSTALETFRGEALEDASFVIGTLLVVERSSLENRPRGL